MYRITYQQANGDIYMSNSFTNDKDKIRQMANFHEDKILEIRKVSEQDQQDFIKLVKSS